MTKEEKDLLLKDLCARLPYGVIVAFKSQESERSNCGVFFKIGLGYGNIGYVAELGRGWWTDCKPYLRPMSSMTEDEKEEYIHIKQGECNGCVLTGKGDPNTEFLLVDFFNSHHLDYRGLIEKGLAIEVTEENNPYK